MHSLTSIKKKTPSKPIMSDKGILYKHSRSRWDSTSKMTTTMDKPSSFFNNIKEEYGVCIRRLLKKYMRINKGLTEAKSKRRFLLKCRTCDVKPKHINSISNSTILI